MLTLREITSLKKDCLVKSIAAYKLSKQQIESTIYSPQFKYYGITPLVEYIMDRASSMHQLIRLNKIDDAGIIYRSLLEVFMKALYIVTSKSDEIYNERSNEYWVVLKEIETLRESDKAKILVKSERISFGKVVFPGFILSVEEEEEMKQRPSWSNRKYRTDIKNRWSYSSLSKDIANDDNVTQFVPLELLDNDYKMMSHAAHGDEKGISSIREIKYKHEYGRKWNNLGMSIKYLRISNDIIYWLAVEIFRKNKSVNDILEIDKNYSPYTNEMLITQDEVIRQYLFDRNAKL